MDFLWSASISTQKGRQLRGPNKGKQVVAARTVAEFVANLDTPRRVLMMVPAGEAVDAVIADLRPYLNRAIS